MVVPYTFQPIILLRITPAANRNSYRVAMLVGQLPRVAVFARNPGLGNRNSFRVAAAYVVFVMEGILFVCMDVGCSTMPGFTNINDISGPLWMVRTPGNSVGVAIS